MREVSNARRFIQERFPHASGSTMFHLADVEKLMQEYREDLREHLADAQAENERLRGVLERANVDLLERHGLNDYFTDALATGGEK